MSDPRDFIDAESPAVSDVLAEMTRIMLQGGGTLHPGLTMRERGGALTVLCHDVPGAAPKQPLFEVPREMLVPVDGARWHETPDELALREAPPGLSQLQLDLLQLHLALYNTCGKLPHTVVTHPRLALVSEPDLVAAVQALRPDFRVTDGAAMGESVSPAVSTFLGTRAFGLAPIGHPDASANPEPKLRQRVLMTLIDLLNHHPDGAPYRVDSRTMKTAVARPTATVECFANYGHRRDSLDLALNYAYVDSATEFVHCPPLTAHVPGSGSVKVLGTRRRKAPYAHVDPPQVTVTADGVTLSHLVFRPTAAGRWDLPVIMALESRALQQGADPMGARACGQEGARLIAVEVIDLLITLRDAAQARSEENPAAAILLGAAERQLSVMHRLAPTVRFPG